MVYAGIVAGGSGTRMGADMPKQFLEIGGVPILVKTVRRFADCPEIDRVYVGINPEWKEYAGELFDRFGVGAELIDGGRDRNGTVLNILSAISAEHEVSPGDVLVTHDAVRPFVSRDIILRSIAAAREHLACGTYIPSEDTVVRSSDGTVVTENLVRSELRRAQTPQSFEMTALMGCIEGLGAKAVSELTDTCGIMTACGHEIRIVEGDPINFKITTPYDLRIARLLARDGE